MRVQLRAVIAACALAAITSTAYVSTAYLSNAAQSRAAVRRITWDDVVPLRARLEALGLTSASFPAYVERVREANARRVREGDLDHLIFYLLQSTHFTSLPPIEPAVSARALVEGLDPPDRLTFLKDPQSARSRVDPAVRSRGTALLRALQSPSRDPRDPRLIYFRELVTATFPDQADREAALQREYLRVMQFVYEKEFVAQRSGPEAVADLYRARGLSTDTAVEAGYVVYLGLGVVKALQLERRSLGEGGLAQRSLGEGGLARRSLGEGGPDHRIRRVLIVGPGLDLAPRTALIEAGPPESYQPWAVIDALLALGLSRAGDLEVVGADINPRVVQHLRRARAEPPTLTLVSGIRESPTLSIGEEYRDYFTRLGRSIGTGTGGAVSDAKGHLRKTIRVGPSASRALAAETLDVVTESLDGPPFDLVVATNILPYFDDVGLMLAMSNVARMLAPGGVFLHNEARPLMHEVTAALGMPFEQSRHAIIASVKGAPAPLFDSVWLHRKAVR